MGVLGVFPSMLYVGDETRDEHEIEIAFSDDLVGDAVITAPGVASRRALGHSAGIIGWLSRELLSSRRPHHRPHDSRVARAATQVAGEVSLHLGLAGMRILVEQ